MRLYYDNQVRARLTACLDNEQPDVTFKSANEKAQLERLDNHCKYAERVTEDNPHTDWEGKSIPVGYYAITEPDGRVYASEPSFFESVWFPYEPFN
jgi:hypothetical protein